MNRKPFFWIAAAALVGLVSIGANPAEAASSKTRAKRVVYSAARSQTRKAKLASARAIATAREMAETVLPRYKVDGNGDLVPDVRAAAYEPPSAGDCYKKSNRGY